MEMDRNIPQNNALAKKTQNNPKQPKLVKCIKRLETTIRAKNYQTVLTILPCYSFFLYARKNDVKRQRR